MRATKIWAATHPNELEAIAFDDSLTEKPIANVEGGKVNLAALALGNWRQTGSVNQNAAYPGDRTSKIPEIARAPEVIDESQGFYSAVDNHNIGHGVRGADTVYIGRRGVTGEVLGFIAEMGVKNLVLFEGNCLMQHVPNVWMLDTAAVSVRSQVSYQRGAFDYFANSPSLGIARPEDFTWYRHVGDVTPAQTSHARLPEDLQGFERLPKEAESALALPGSPPVHMLSWSPTTTSGIFMEIVTPIAPPDNKDRGR